MALTIEQRLELIHAGYSRSEIEEFELAMQKPEEKPEEKPESNDIPAWATALQKSIDKLVSVTQAHNAQFDDMGDDVTQAKRADNALAEYITGTKRK